MPQISVAVLATLDSKHEAVRFACDVLERAGVTPWRVDLSLRPHAQGCAHVSASELAVAPETSWEALAALPRAEAAQAMTTGGKKIVRRKVEAGGLAGALGLGGANGSTMACAIMRALSLGFPKVMVTPVAATAAVQ